MQDFFIGGVWGNFGGSSVGGGGSFGRNSFGGNYMSGIIFYFCFFGGFFRGAGDFCCTAKRWGWE